MPAPRPDWLAGVKEEALDPSLPICDPHHHLWQHPENRYLLEELLADTGDGHNVVSTVFVECTSKYLPDGPPELRPVGETAFVDAVARSSAPTDTRVGAGIVGFADLTLGAAVEAVLEAHLEASPERFRGIRHASGWDASEQVRNSHTHPPPGLLASPEFRAGFEKLASLDLSFDAWLYHPQIGELADLAAAFPHARIVLDHVGGPLGIGPYAGRREEVFAAWADSIRALAERENVHLKLGGLVMPINGFAWHKRPAPPDSSTLAGALEPYLAHCIEHFGAERCMFESNFPVDKVSCSYTVLWNAFKRIASGAGEAERRALFYDTAVSFYRI